MLRRPLTALLSGIVAWCAVAAADRVVAAAGAEPDLAAGAEQALLSQGVRPEPRVARIKGTRGTDGATSSSPVALAGDGGASPPLVVTTAAPPPQGAPRIDSLRSSPRSSRGPPA